MPPRKAAPPRPAYVEETPSRPHDLVRRRFGGGTVVRGAPRLGVEIGAAVRHQSGMKKSPPGALAPWFEQADDHPWRWATEAIDTRQRKVNPGEGLPDRRCVQLRYRAACSFASVSPLTV